MEDFFKLCGLLRISELYKRFFCFCFAELGKDERFRGKFKKKEGNKTGLSIKKVPQRLKVAGDDPDAKMTGYLHKVSTLKEFQALHNL